MRLLVLATFASGLCAQVGIVTTQDITQRIEVTHSGMINLGSGGVAVEAIPLTPPSEPALVIATTGAHSADCSTGGGGTSAVLCFWDGTSFAALTLTGSATIQLVNGAIETSPGVATYGADGTWAGNQDFSRATLRMPGDVGLPPPAACTAATIGRTYVNTAPGGSPYYCLQSTPATYKWAALTTCVACP